MARTPEYLILIDSIFYLVAYDIEFFLQTPKLTEATRYVYEPTGAVAKLEAINPTHTFKIVQI